ncbi:MAG: hypothetical protein ACE5NG_12365 [bacterium]
MSEELRIVKIREQFKDEWVVVQITKTDKYDVPTSGIVLFHGQNKEEIYDKGFNYRMKNPESDLYFFYTGDLVPKGMGVMLGAR